MYNNKKFLAIIPARGGSKRLPRKNALALVDKPLISWSIEAGLKSQYLDKVLVTTDDKELIKISEKYGVNILKRPADLATDTTTTLAVIEHAIEQTNEEYDYIMLLQPTSPLRNEKHIDEAIELLFTKGADAVISVCEMEHSPLWSNILPESGDMSHFLRDEIKNKRSQDLQPYFRINGAIYICHTKRLLKEQSFFIKSNIFAYIMEQSSSIDIDTTIDFTIAEALLSKLAIS